MKRILEYTVAILLGTLALHCASSGSHGHGPNDGALDGIGHADADTGSCCQLTAPTFTKLAEGDLQASSTQSATSPAIAVGAYRQVIIYQSGCAYGSSLTARFRPDASTVFGGTGQITTYYGGQLRVDGSDMVLVYGDQTSCHYVVAGVN
jgi:hypothetical protein